MFRGNVCIDEMTVHYITLVTLVKIHHGIKNRIQLEFTIWTSDTSSSLMDAVDISFMEVWGAIWWCETTHYLTNDSLVLVDSVLKGYW